MSREDYMIGNDNISKLAKIQKQKNGQFNLDKAVRKLREYDIDFNIIVQGLKFELNGDKYTYWSKKNRVYKGSYDTDMTLIKFIKENKQYFNFKDDVTYDFIIKFGKYKGKLFSEICGDESYVNYLLDKSYDEKLKEKIKQYFIKE